MTLSNHPRLLPGNTIEGTVWAQRCRCGGLRYWHSPLEGCDHCDCPRFTLVPTRRRHGVRLSFVLLLVVAFTGYALWVPRWNQGWLWLPVASAVLAACWMLVIESMDERYRPRHRRQP